MTVTMLHSIGRSGVTWFSHVLDQHRNVSVFNESHPAAEAYVRWCRWNSIPFDYESFVDRIMAFASSRDQDRVVYGAPWLSSCLEELSRRREISNVFLFYRDPLRLVCSLARKGWYLHPVTRGNPHLAPGPQLSGSDVPHRFMSRPVPRGEEFERWSRLTRIGRLAWYVNRAFDELLDGCSHYPAQKVWPVDIADVDQNFEYYQMAADLLGLEPKLTRAQFLDVKTEHANSTRNPMKPDDWSSRERRDFNSEMRNLDRIRSLSTRWP